ncbi:Phosphatidylinositol 4-phosphate 5-kinase 10 [Hibiscus syriacus]|uniref:1-phosphatidylinositol-4-phosphate 5-kinase n=1 Tax=Hibiscus syriacus TaxID=106335 RepID=A0A6A2XMP2_HIBSY|nr:putative phosphatidylinositol 4-phosphate 5-kinase 11 [Hibiscus syriacus]KAE8657677.1 Phosphatidylinositol 4-phosphate 5-kinase 10 [Hibiscus syriacus]
MALSDDELSAADLTNAQNNWIEWPSRKHCNNLPPGAVTGFEWKDYCPRAFRLIQELDNIDKDDYMILVCSDETIRKVTSTSRPGNMFLFSNDTGFAIKTLRKSEVKILLEMLPGYYSHLKRFRNTVLNKLYGVHAVTPFGGTKAYFVVVANIFKSDLYMHRCYDLKGSLQGRKLEKMRYRDKILHKESDLDFIFYIKPLVRQRLLKQIQHDCAFLEATGIMDYSLMLGLHVKESPKGCADSRCSNNGMRVFDVELHQSDLASRRPFLASYVTLVQIVNGREFRRSVARNNRSGSALPCRNVTVIECYDVLLCFGVVDFFQNYSVIKRIEHAYKSLQFDRRMIAAVHPKAYSSRFQEFISDIFKADECLT